MIATRIQRAAAGVGWRKVLAAGLMVAALGEAAAEAEPNWRLDVPYVPTPQPVVEAMLAIAQVSSADFVMDVGCGDGRMIVTAAKRHGARGVGVDIDPLRILDAQRSARSAGVSDKAKFLVGDLYETDISQADVLAIYLFNEINLRLRPKILTTMKPGSRVVSHAFHMGDWQADRIERIAGKTVYFWVVPARVAGHWQVHQGDRRIDLALSQEHQFLTGTASEGGSTFAVREGRVNGSEVSYVLETPGGRQTYRGRIEGDRIAALDDEPATWRAIRQLP